ncbi:MAG: hypothetical protein D6762_01950 [Candidatus Neomarinimicrobiota bacterium]|nr:MAG: hypothetical protein D6762_01950 [Candidatus Neomarinimicrobiota bacterium]
MNPWELNANLQTVVLDLLYLSSFILIGTFLRRYIGFFQSFLIHTEIIGGYIGRFVGSQGLGWIDLQADRLILYVYHFLALTFIALGLRQEKTKWGRGPLSKSLAALSSYLLQATIGLGVAFLLVYSLMPDLFVGIGLVVPLGFGMGPGLAATLAGSWEKFGFEGGAQVGLTFATVGYMYAFFVGMALIHWGIRTRQTALIEGVDHVSRDMRIGINKEGENPIAGRMPQSTEAVEPMAFHLALIGFVYLLTYWVVNGLATFLTNKGLTDFVPTLWSFHFVVGLLLAIAVRKLLDMTGRSYLIDQGLMTRGMGLFLDYLVVGAIAGISLTVVVKYWIPITIMCLLAGPATLWLLYYVCYRAFDDFHFERFIELFGEMTGTINSALVLLRVVDPEFKTPVAEDAVYGSGISLFLGFPLLIVLNMPFVYFGGTLRGYWITLGIILGYWVFLTLLWRVIGFIHFGAPQGRPRE